jgi:hypothetical protein
MQSLYRGLLRSDAKEEASKAHSSPEIHIYIEIILYGNM